VPVFAKTGVADTIVLPYRLMSLDNTLPVRRSIRLPDFDYSQGGQYFLTMCAFQMRFLFGEVKNNTILLNVIGRIAVDCWRDIPNHFSRVELPPFVVMPNHVHGILTIKDGHGCPVPLQNQHATERFQHPTVRSVPTIVRSYKSEVTYLARKYLQRASLQVWQSNYFERVLRNADEFSNACRYIFENPMMWHLDKANRKGLGHPCPSSPST
jgi:REP-associated tyrosine transposase